MGCCGDTIKKAGVKLAHIATGYSKLAFSFPEDWMTERIKICGKCLPPNGYRVNAWCKKCKCFILAKVQVKDEHCPIGKW